MAERTNVQETSCGLRGFERNRYFFGKQLTVRDFDTEQRYFNGKRYLLNRLVHSWGVVCGLRVEWQSGDKFKLGPGAAIDCCGREIVVGDEDLVYSLADLEGYKSLEDPAKTFYICLKYDECIREPVQTVSNASSCTDVCDYNRIREGFKLFVTAEGPAQGPGMDFCGLATAGHLLATGSPRSLRVERFVPRWVNPKEVFEVLLVATATRQDGVGTITLRVDESFAAGALTLAQGNDKSFTLTLGPSDTRVERRYMVRAGAAGKAVIGCDLSVTGGGVTLSPEQNRNSEVEVVEGAVADRLVQTFFEGELSVCPSCAEDHCLYLASATLAADKLDLKLFPSNQYLYNNEMLYDLLACGGQRVGKVPEIPALGQAGEIVVPAVNSMKFSDGVKVVRNGDGRADVSANVEGGLEVTPAGKIVTRRGDGITLDAGQLAAKLGKGLEFDDSAPPRAVTVNKGDGLDFDAGGRLKVNLDTGRGLDFDKSTPTKVLIKEGAGISFDSSGALKVNADEGLTVSGDIVVANTGDGLDVQGKKIVANPGDGLKFDERDQPGRRRLASNTGDGLNIQNGKVGVNPGDGLTFPPGQAGGRALTAKLGQGLEFDAGTPTKAIVVKEGAGLGFESGALRVKVGEGVTINNDAVAANVGDGLAVLSNRIVVDAGDGLTFGAPDSTGHRKVIAAPPKVEVQKEGAPAGTEQRLNFVGKGVSVSDEPGAKRVNISIPGRVEVQKDGQAAVLERRRLNFTGEGVSIQDEGNAERVNINIPGGAGVQVRMHGAGRGVWSCLNFTGGGVAVRPDPAAGCATVDIPGVSTGEVTFDGVLEGKSTFLPAHHGLPQLDVAFVLCYVPSAAKLSDTLAFLNPRIFGDISISPTSSAPRFCVVQPSPEQLPPTEQDLFYIYLVDQRPFVPIRTPVAVSYRVRWWAIASTAL